MIPQQAISDHYATNGFWGHYFSSPADCTLESDVEMALDIGPEIIQGQAFKGWPWKSHKNGILRTILGNKKKAPRVKKNNHSIIEGASAEERYGQSYYPQSYVYPLRSALYIFSLALSLASLSISPPTPHPPCNNPMEQKCGRADHSIAGTWQ